MLAALLRVGIRFRGVGFFERLDRSLLEVFDREQLEAIVPFLVPIPQAPAALMHLLDLAEVETLLRCSADLRLWVCRDADLFLDVLAHLEYDGRVRPECDCFPDCSRQASLDGVPDDRFWGTSWREPASVRRQKRRRIQKRHSE